MMSLMHVVSAIEKKACKINRRMRDNIMWPLLIAFPNIIICKICYCMLKSLDNYLMTRLSLSWVFQNSQYSSVHPWNAANIFSAGITYGIWKKKRQQLEHTTD